MGLVWWLIIVWLLIDEKSGDSLVIEGKVRRGGRR